MRIVDTGEAPSNDQPVGPYPVVIQGPSGGHVLVVQEYTYGKYLGRLDLTFDENGHVTKWGGNPILLNASIPEGRCVLLVSKEPTYTPSVRNMVKLGGGGIPETFIWAEHRPTARPIVIMLL